MENTKKKEPKYSKGDLIFSNVNSFMKHIGVMGFIKEVIEKDNNFYYKIDFQNIGLRVPDMWKTEPWKEESIHARIISKAWSIQKCTT